MSRKPKQILKVRGICDMEYKGLIEVSLKDALSILGFKHLELAQVYHSKKVETDIVVYQSFIAPLDKADT